MLFRSSIGLDTLTPLVRLRPGEAFVAATLDDAVNAVRVTYRERGFVGAAVKGVVTTEGGAAAAGERRVRVSVEVVEGVRTLIRSVSFTGNRVLPGDELAVLAALSPGQAFTAATMAAARDRLDLEYRNRGFESVAKIGRAHV